MPRIFCANFSQALKVFWMEYNIIKEKKCLEAEE